MVNANQEGYARETMPRLAEQLDSLRAVIPQGRSAEDLYDQVQSFRLGWKNIELNLDVYEHAPDAPVLIFFCGISNYARFYYIFLALLSERGFNVVAVDRPGHGFSGGARGDCTVDDVRDFMPSIIDWVTTRYNDRIGLFGTSLGGITTFYLLPDVDGVKSALCHNWLYPGELVDQSKRGLSIVLKLLNRLHPRMKVPIRKLMDRDKVCELSSQARLVDYFMHIERDPIYCQALTLRSVVSYFGGYRPTKSYAEVDIPVLGLISEYESVLPLETSKTWWARAGFSDKRIKIVPEAKHMIFHDRTADLLETVADWFHKTL